MVTCPGHHWVPVMRKEVGGVTFAPPVALPPRQHQVQKVALPLIVVTKNVPSRFVSKNDRCALYGPSFVRDSCFYVVDHYLSAARGTH